MQIVSIQLETTQNSSSLLVDGSVNYSRSEHVFTLATQVASM
jgi:hypothetical protein